jgi:NAD(P)-dependent dehydrogenase (short-subunit alcohol dehydrogenase family)
LSQIRRDKNDYIQYDKPSAGVVENQSVKKFIDPADIAELVKFLAGKHARTISGQSFPIDGDSKSTQ